MDTRALLIRLRRERYGSRARAAAEFERICRRNGWASPGRANIEKQIYRVETGQVATPGQFYATLYCAAYDRPIHELFSDVDLATACEATAPAVLPGQPSGVPTTNTRLAGSVRAAPGQVRADGFVPINTWSSGRSLLPEHVDLRYVGDHPGNLTNASPSWNSARASFTAAGRRGSVASVVGLRAFDYRDAPGQDQFRLDIARIDYAAQLATRSLLATNPVLRDSLQSLLMHEGLNAFLTQVPPSAVAANINVISADRQVLLVQRSAMVATYPSQWNLGLNETMNYYNPPETFFGLIYRGLAEEAGLRVQDIGRAVVSWFGYCFDCGNFYLFAHAAAKLAAADALTQIADSRDSYEHSDLEWVPLDPSSLQSIVDGGPAPDGSRRWLHHARLSALELWRTRNSL